MNFSQRVDRALQRMEELYRRIPAIPRDLLATAFFLCAAYGASRILIDHTGGENISALVFVLAVLLFFWIKGKAGHMDEETWDAWFRGLPNGAYGGLFLVLYALPLALLSAVGYLLWAWLGLAAPALLAGLTFLFGLLGALRKLDAHKGELWEKLRNIC